MSFPAVRMRRLRRSEGLRRLVRETRVAPADLVQPLFVVSGSGVDRPIESLPGQRHVSADVAAAIAAEARPRRRRNAALRPARPQGRGGLVGLGRRRAGAGGDPGDASRRARAADHDRRLPLPVHSHGACGVLHDGQVDNDATLPLLARVALSHARAGADAVAPSDMMDGRVGRDPQRARRRRPATRRSSRTARSSPRPSTGRSATPPDRRRSRATARATSSTRPMRARPCARRCSTPPRAPTR